MILKAQCKQGLEDTRILINKDNVRGIYSSKNLARNSVNHLLDAMQRKVFVNYSYFEPTLDQNYTWDKQGPVLPW